MPRRSPTPPSPTKPQSPRKTHTVAECNAKIAKYSKLLSVHGISPAKEERYKTKIMRYHRIKAALNAPPSPPRRPSAAIKAPLRLPGPAEPSDIMVIPNEATNPPRSPTFPPPDYEYTDMDNYMLMAPPPTTELVPVFDDEPIPAEDEGDGNVNLATLIKRVEAGFVAPGPSIKPGVMTVEYLDNAIGTAGDRVQAEARGHFLQMNDNLAKIKWLQEEIFKLRGRHGAMSVNLIRPTEESEDLCADLHEYETALSNLMDESFKAIHGHCVVMQDWAKVFGTLKRNE
jgi:hypothetical protein